MFSQGAFQQNQNDTPETIARKRAMIQAMMPRFGSAKYTGEGIGQLATGIAMGARNRGLDKVESDGTQGASDIFSRIMGGAGRSGGTGSGGMVNSPFSPPMPVDPNSPDALASDTMSALGKGNSPEGIKAGLVARGMPEHIADGFIMNFQDESGLNPGINEAAPTVAGSRGGFGLAQWTGPRRKALEAFAAQRGVDVSDMGVQLDFLMTELQGPEANAWSKISAAPDSGQAAAAVLNHFERPAEEHRARREAEYLGGQPAQDLAPLYEAMANPFMSQEQRAVLTQMIQQGEQQADPGYQMGLEKQRMELDQMRNPQADPMAEIELAQARLNLDQDRTGAGADVPSGFQTLDLQAQAAGFAPGTPEYQQFMQNGGGSGTPAAFTALDMQAQAAGLKPGTPEYQQFMATRGAGLQAEARAIGTAQGEAIASAPTQIANGEIAIQGIDEIRNHEGMDRGTGLSSYGNAIRGTQGYAFETRVKQLAGGAFLTAIQQLQGMGALSNSEGQTATAALARLQPGLSRPEFEDALADYEQIVKSGMERAQRKIEGQAAPAPITTPGGNTIRFDADGNMIQ